MVKMALNLQWAKTHWYYIVGGVFGLIVLYELVKSLSGSSSAASSSTDLSGGASQVQDLTAAADLQNALVNGQIEQASIAGNVASDQTAASLQLGEVQTAAQLEATNNQTSAAETVALAQTKAGVQTEQIAANAAVAQTQIEGNTIDTLGAQKEAVAQSQVSAVSSQIMQVLNHSKHASQDLAAIAPVIAEETGQGSSAPGVASANTAKAVGTAAVEGGVANTALNGIKSIAAGLFS